MKRIIAALLSAALLWAVLILPVSPPVSAADDGALHFAVATDLHYVTPLPTVNTKMTTRGEVSFNDQTGGQTAKSGYILDSFLSQCADDDMVDFVLISGDLATFGRDFASEHEAVAAKFRAFEKETGKQVYVINGNHDNGAGTVTDHTRFCEVYYEFGYDEAVSREENSCSYAVNLNDEYMLIALDSCDENYKLVNGIDSARSAWVFEQAKAAKASGRKPILMMHHNLLEHFPYEQITQDSYMVSWPRITAARFANAGIHLVFSGHTHMNDTACLTTLAGNTVYDFSNGSLGNYPGEYKTFCLSDEAVTYETKQIKTVDGGALSAVCSGFSNDDISLMNTDFQAWLSREAYNAFAGSLNNRLTASQFGIKEGSILYEDAESVMRQLRAMLDEPIYGENGLAADAARYGITIPSSDYTTLRDMITRVYLDAQKGEKQYDRNSESFKTVALLIDYAVKKAAVTGLNGDTLAAKLISALLGANWSPTPAENIFVNLLYRLLGGYIGETDGAENRNGSLPPLGTEESVFIRLLFPVFTIG